MVTMSERMSVKWRLAATGSALGDALSMRLPLANWPVVLHTPQYLGPRSNAKVVLRSTWNGERAFEGTTAMSDYQHRLGERLRAIRGQQGLTLQDVEEMSKGEWKAVVVGSYERGDRAVSVSKLARLADFYRVPLSDLLPTTSPGPAAEQDSPRLVVDLVKLEALEGEDSYEVIRRYVTQVQSDRGDYNGRVLTLREGDLRSLAIASGDHPESLITKLAAVGALR